jgi:8-oxo-dGTP diphosphatase
MISKFNIRVYGIFINDHHQVLLSDENYNAHQFTKFPGGGLEFGEGTADCIIREFKEELNIDIEIEKHLYTTDFFQQSAFNKHHQIISIYYKVKLKNCASNNFIINNAPENTKEQFRFVPLKELVTDSVTLPIDKVVVKLLQQGI